jgi:hypothetical protein
MQNTARAQKLIERYFEQMGDITIDLVDTNALKLAATWQMIHYYIETRTRRNIIEINPRRKKPGRKRTISR